MKRCVVWIILLIALTGLAACKKQEADNTIGKDAIISTAPTQTSAIEPGGSPVVSEEASIPSEEGYGAETSMVETNAADLDENLCAGNEEVLFSFPIKASRKRLTVCIEKDNQEYIVYRFGTKDKVELVYPDSETDSWNKFVYSYYFRGGDKENEGQDLNYLTFENNGFRYRIYQEYSADSKETEVGILVTDLASGKDTRLVGVSEEAEGNLINLRDSDKITVENE